jgi:hypothetical protein
MNMYYPHSPSLEEIGEKPIKFYKNVRVRAWPHLCPGSKFSP